MKDAHFFSSIAMHHRWRAALARERNETYDAIQRKYGYSRDYIARWSKRYRETGNVEDKPRSGRPKALNKALCARLAKKLKSRRGESLRTTAAYLQREHNVSVSVSTVRREAQRLDLVYMRRRNKPLLNSEHKLARLRFARARRPSGFWSRVMWSDEASFALYSHTKGVWVERGSEPPIKETVKWPPRIRVWAAISSRGKTPLLRIPKRMNAKQYEALLVNTLLPAMDDAYGGESRDYVLMQDGDGCHTAKSVQKCLKKEGITQLLPWPAHSPDLNPIENAWSIVERHLEKAHPTTARGLWKAMQEGWEKIGNDTLLRLTSSLPSRLSAVKYAHGGHTKY